MSKWKIVLDAGLSQTGVFTRVVNHVEPSRLYDAAGEHIRFSTSETHHLVDCDYCRWLYQVYVQYIQSPDDYDKTKVA